MQLAGATMSGIAKYSASNTMRQPSATFISYGSDARTGTKKGQGLDHSRNHIRCRWTIGLGIQSAILAGMVRRRRVCDRRFYLVRTSRHFLAAVEQLLRTEQPCDMHLTIRGTAQQIDEHYYAELRFPPIAGAAPWDIRLYVGYQPWFEVIQNPLSAKV
jgi:hypothetical protein